MAFPLPTDRLPPGTTALRLRTNLEIYWDRLTVIRSEDCPGLVRQELKLAVADLRESGFMVRQLKEQFRPHFDYTTRAAHPEIIDPEGFYTRFGAVEELVGTADDAVAIFGPGEEIHVEFEAPESGPPKGWTRRLVLETVGEENAAERGGNEGRPSYLFALTSGSRFNTRYQRGW